MPDNVSPGTLETFLHTLVPPESASLWAHARRAVASAKKRGALCREVHLPKAELYTWLSWADPPGQSPGLALTKRVLDPHLPSAQPFVAWFKRLYNL